MIITIRFDDNSIVIELESGSSIHFRPDTRDAAAEMVAWLLSHYSPSVPMRKARHQGDLVAGPPSLGYAHHGD